MLHVKSISQYKCQAKLQNGSTLNTLYMGLTKKKPLNPTRNKFISFTQVLTPVNGEFACIP